MQDTHQNDNQPEPEQCVRERDGAIIAYHRTACKGEKKRADEPGVVFLTGFKSDMTGGKALHLEAHARDRGLDFLRFDYTGHGRSSGVFEEGTIGQWAEDAIFALDNLTEGPQVLVGSSMGGWIMLLVARARPERVKGLVGIAAAPDFTEDLMWNVFNDEQRADLAEKGRVLVPNCYDDQEPYALTRALIEDGRDQLLLRQPFVFDGPVRLIHGLLDEDVPWKTALRLQETITGSDVEVTLVKGGGHRLSEPHDLDRMTQALDAVMARLL
ncbi:MAG: alpha/beta hydrolase [Rhodospirillales bacterium]